MEASLGYFINPLVSVGLGVLVLRERLRPGQWTAVAIAVVAVAVLTVSYGRLPWISLILGFSFGIYGLLKKQVGAGAVESLTIETAALDPHRPHRDGGLRRQRHVGDDRRRPAVGAPARPPRTR